jgi:hypothetical protein
MLGTAWKRLQETPFELAICALATFQVPITLVAERSLLPWLSITLFIFVALGGLVTCLGRLRYGASIESAGMVLLTGAYAAAVWRILITLTTWEDLANGTLNAVALLVAFGVRLYVLRKTVSLSRREGGDRG